MVEHPTRRKPLHTITLDDCSHPNAGLWLEKYILEQDKQKKTTRGSFVKEVAGISLPENYKSIYQRWQKILDNFKTTGYAINSGKAIVQGRMILGTGNESVLETSVTLHRTYGVPYIPGSALKGLAGSFARHHCGPEWAGTSENYKTVFGNTTESGCILFFDALYACEKDSAIASPLRQDVLTPHHSDYYSGRKDNEGNLLPPTDWDDPTPVPFLSATGTYLVAIAASAGGEEWLKAVWQILKIALVEVGIGGKTSSGYGRMILEDFTDGH